MALHLRIVRKLMSRTLMAFAVVMVLSLGMTACKVKTTSEKVSDSAKSAGQATSDAAKATGAAVGDALKATGEYLTQSKDTDVKAAQETLNRLEKKWQDLLTKAAPTTNEAKADLQKAKDQMAETLADAKAKLVEAKDASADAWQQNVKPTVDAALQKAQRLYEDASTRFSNN
jgi:hypothetical protein